ncbi:MAG: phosphatase PAP2 family protein [Lachnospiraceae bacterium]
MSALLSLDGNLLLWIQNHLRADAMNGFWTFITSLGNGGWVWIVLGILLLFFPKTRKLGILTLLSMLIGFLITNICLKNLVARPRPYTQIPDLTILVKEPHDWSFPSGHTTASFAFAFAFYFGLEHKKYSIPVFVLAALIAFSRLYVGVHYPTDVLGGLLTGTLCAFLAWNIYNRREKKRK